MQKEQFFPFFPFLLFALKMTFKPNKFKTFSAKIIVTCAKRQFFPFLLFALEMTLLECFW